MFNIILKGHLLLFMYTQDYKQCTVAYLLFFYICSDGIFTCILKRHLLLLCTGIRLQAMESSILFCSLSVVISIVFDMYIYYTIERLENCTIEDVDVNAVQVVFWFVFFGLFFFFLTCIHVHASQNHKI